MSERDTYYAVVFKFPHHLEKKGTPFMQIIQVTFRPARVKFTGWATDWHAYFELGADRVATTPKAAVIKAFNAWKGVKESPKGQREMALKLLKMWWAANKDAAA